MKVVAFCWTCDEHADNSETPCLSPSLDGTTVTMGPCENPSHRVIPRRIFGIPQADRCRAAGHEVHDAD